MILEQRRRRSTGMVITIERNPVDLDHDPDHPYVTSCERHATCCSHGTLAGARAAAVFPDWCGDCRRILEARGLLKS